MPAIPGADALEQIRRIREAWRHFDRTGDPTAIADSLAENIVLMPPGVPTMHSKAALVEGISNGHEYDIDRSSEDLFVSGGLAVDRINVSRKREQSSAGGSEGINLKGVDVYRRNQDGEWECFLIIWNHKA